MTNAEIRTSTQRVTIDTNGDARERGAYKRTIYCRAVLPRAGLGNKLFPWARCRVFSLVHNARMLAPQWAQFKIGPALRGESDYRFYHDLFHRRSSDVHGLRELILRILVAERPEPDLLSSPVDGSGPLVVKFEGERDHFVRLNGWNEQLKLALQEITRKRWLRRLMELPEPSIGIHVRRGDFAVPKTPSEMYTRGAVRTPLSWFVDSLKVVRKSLGVSIRASVVSDGDERDLRDLVAMPNVALVKTGSAISDLLFLSKARLLIASGGSSFGAWASFLGQMPTVSHPGQSFAWFKLQNKNGYYVGEFDPAVPSADFLANAAEVID